MSIGNWQAFRENHWDWSVLRGCFGNTKIEPTDIDGEVERNGYFLTLETKAPNVELKYGQLKALRAKARTGYFTIIIIWGKPGCPEKLMWIDKNGDIVVHGGMETLREWVSHWFQCADRMASV